MKKYYFLLLLSVFLLPSCASFGPTVMIQTEQPEQDFVVVCTWAKQPLLGVHGGHQEIKRNVYVTDSNEEVSCGVSLLGGKGIVQTMHPLYWGGTAEEVDGVRIIHNQTKLHHLDELKQKFESGFWDQHKWPGDKFSERVRAVCLGTFNHYFGYYLSEVDKIDFEKFKSRYYQPILECVRKEKMLRSDERIREGIRMKYIDPEEGLKGWWKKMEKIANEY